MKSAVSIPLTLLGVIFGMNRVIAVGLALLLGALPAVAQTTAAPPVQTQPGTPAADQPAPAQPTPWQNTLQLADQALAPMAGDWVTHHALPGITWLQVLLCGLMVLAAAIAERIFNGLMRRKIRRHAEAGEKQASLLRQTLEAGLRPVGLLIWVWGGYAALSILLADLVGFTTVLAGLAWLLRLGSFAALLWFLVHMMDVVEAQLEQWAAKSQTKWDDILALVVARAFRWITPLVAVILFLPTLHVSAGSHEFLNELASVLLILAIGFILAQLVDALADGVARQFNVDVKDNLAARKVQTQVVILKRIAFLIIGLFTVALALMVFGPVRHVGSSLLASAGVAGIIIGFAAQRSLGTLVAGLQLAVTQPIRIDDVVIVENEWGRIEEINLTYVVVRIWDLRRLVVPINYFIEKPFQNWTRVSADLLGTVMVYVDYTMPLKALREELDRILDQSSLWDRKVKVLQVTDAKQQTLEVRALFSAADASTAWDLRCEVRERLVDFLQRDYPQCLPRMRAEIETPPADKAAPVRRAAPAKRRAKAEGPAPA